MNPDRTTVAETLKQVFTKLNDVIPVQHDGSALLVSWTKLLGGAGRTEFHVIDSMSQILTAITKLEDQLKASKIIDAVTRDAALVTTQTFKGLFSLQSLSQPAFQFKGICNPALIGQLGMISLGLNYEFSEPKLSKEDNQVLMVSLNEIKKLLKEGGMPLDLRVNLERHVDNILWWLARPELMSLQDIFEKAGSASLVATQIESTTAQQSDAQKTAGRKIRTQMGVVLEKMASAIGFVVKNADKIEKIEQTYTKLLGHSGNG